MSERTAELTPGEVKQLHVTVLQGVPTDLPPELVREHIGGGKGALQQAIRMLLHADPRTIDAAKLYEVLNTPNIRFQAEERQGLLRAGWEIVQVPGILEAPVTLNQLYLRAADFRSKVWGSWHEGFTREDIEYFPLPAGEIAWYPSDPLIPGSVKKSFAEQEEIVADHSRDIQKCFGDGVEAIFPTTEHGVYLPFDHRRRTGTYILSDRHTRTVNRFKSRRLYVGPCVFGYGLGVHYWLSGGRDRSLGVLRLIVPKTA